MNELFIGLSSVCILQMGLIFYLRKTREEGVKRMLRRHVAYEGKLRELGHNPDRVYHDFENMLENDSNHRPAKDFEPDVRYEEKQE